MEETKVFVLGSVSTYETEAFATSLQSANKPKQSEVSKNLVVIPPDGGWGWVVVVAAFISYFMTEGVICGFGIFLSEMALAFNCNLSQVSLIGAIMTGCFCFSGEFYSSVLHQYTDKTAGPFSAALVNRYGFRKIGIIGSLIGTSSCILTSFSSSLYVTFFTYGFMAGLGYGMMYVATTIVVGYYFEKWRPLAIGIAVCGAGVGSVSLPPVIYNIVTSLGWRKTYRIMGALTLICVGTTSTYRPLVPIDLTTIIKSSDAKIASESNVVAEDSSKVQKELSYGEGVSFEKGNKIPKDSCCGEGVSFEPTESSTVTLFQPSRLPRIVSSETIISSGNEKDSGYIKPLKLDFKNSRFTDSHLSTVQEEDLGAKRSKFCCCPRKSHRKKLYIRETYWSRTKKVFSGQKTHMRPMYRDDIFYSGSLLTLPEYEKSSTKSTTTKQSVRNSFIL